MWDENKVKQIIDPIIYETYGKGTMITSLVNILAKGIISGDYHYRTREDFILHTCWNFMTGGTTAEYVAKQIEQALRDANYVG